jgi:sugar lactone lactonase YvrE
MASRTHPFTALFRGVVFVRERRTLAILRRMGSLLLFSSLLAAQQDILPFNDAHWNLANARVVEHLGRQALMGFATLKNTEFENGVIEYDVAVTGARSYPGVGFRSRPGGHWERVYLRPHRSGRVAPSLYPDVLQYVPAWNRSDSWQLYSGKGYTAGAVIPVGRWFHVRIEVSGERARVFVDNHARPDLEIPHLRHGLTRGGVFLMGPADGSAFFSQVSVRKGEALDFGPARREDPQPGFLRTWQISQPLRALDVDDQETALPGMVPQLQWQAVQSDLNGLVDVARTHPRSGQPDTVYLKTILRSERAGIHAYRFGYSDSATLYLNGLKVYSGDASYQGRDPSFLGILGLHDTIHLPLKAGDNEVVVALSEVMGGWGFQMQDAEAEYRAPGLTQLWKTGKRFGVPESVAYDAKRQALYVSNYEPFSPPGGQSISRLGLQGGEPQVLIQGLRNPTGLAVHQDRLYAVEPRSVAEIDLEKRELVRRVELPEAVALNDITVDEKGTLYVSDPPAGVIYRIAKGQPEAWLKGPEVARPNGICLSGDRLLWANNGDGQLKAVDLKTGKISLLADLNGGLLDGLVNGPEGSWLVSHHEGRLYQVSTRGEVTQLLDLTVAGVRIADFEYLPDQRTVVIPTFYDNRVMAVSLQGTGKKRKGE